MNKFTDAQVAVNRTKVDGTRIRLKGSDIELGKGSNRISGTAAMADHMLEHPLPQIGSERLTLREGAWMRSVGQLTERAPVVLLYNHDWSVPAYASTANGSLSLKDVTPSEFRWTATLSDDSMSSRLYAGLKDGTYSGSSIGGAIAKHNWVDDRSIEIVELDVRGGDVSVVDVPADPAAQSVALRLADPGFRQEVIDGLFDNEGWLAELAKRIEQRLNNTTETQTKSGAIMTGQELEDYIWLEQTKLRLAERNSL